MAFQHNSHKLKIVRESFRAVFEIIGRTRTRRGRLTIVKLTSQSPSQELVGVRELPAEAMATEMAHEDEAEVEIAMAFADEEKLAGEASREP